MATRRHCTNCSRRVDGGSHCRRFGPGWSTCPIRTPPGADDHLRRGHDLGGSADREGIGRADRARRRPDCGSSVSILFRLFAESAGHLVRRRMPAIGVPRFRFLLRNRSAAGFVRRVTVAVIGNLRFATAAGRIAALRGGESGVVDGNSRRSWCFFGCGFTVADALLVVSHASSSRPRIESTIRASETSGLGRSGLEFLVRATVAAPNLPTTMLAASLASRAASNMLPPAAMASASVAMTVSPAPVTSATSRAEAGR